MGSQWRERVVVVCMLACGVVRCHLPVLCSYMPRLLLMVVMLMAGLSHLMPCPSPRHLHSLTHTPTPAHSWCVSPCCVFPAAVECGGRLQRAGGDAAPAVLHWGPPAGAAHDGGGGAVPARHAAVVAVGEPRGGRREGVGAPGGGVEGGTIWGCGGYR